MVFSRVVLFLIMGRAVCLGVSNQRCVLWYIVKIGSGFSIRTISGDSCVYFIVPSCATFKLLSLAISGTL